MHITQPDSGDAGHVLWPASEYFSHYLEEKPTKFPIRGKRWIELGAGCGLIGLVLKHLAAAEVTITDLAPIVPNLRVNAQSNFPEDLSCGALKIKALDWGSMIPSEWESPYDGIVASDVLYLPQYFDALIQCMRTLSSARTVILLTGFIRGSQSHDRWVEAARSFFNISKVVERKCIDDDGDDTAGLEHQETWFILKLTKKEATPQTSDSNAASAASSQAVSEHNGASSICEAPKQVSLEDVNPSSRAVTSESAEDVLVVRASSETVPKVISETNDTSAHDTQNKSSRNLRKKGKKKGKK